ncbi:Hypothetical predicted protein [Podarcis lilfordi]|uniref:Uncharacterized protein n=1 Tax=Podarcis lilfordi TaxID=74358 RepID=A0AA35P3P8_9SAUR|nr:Hypothetical predicted protein [Podarcis lilfordi]
MIPLERVLELIKDIKKHAPNCSLEIFQKVMQSIEKNTHARCPPWTEPSWPRTCSVFFQVIKTEWGSGHHQCHLELLSKLEHLHA